MFRKFYKTVDEIQRKNYNRISDMGKAKTKKIGGDNL